MEMDNDIKKLLLLLDVIPARANASSPVVISSMAIPNLLDISIACVPTSEPISCLPLIASTFAVAGWNSIAL